MNLVAKQVRWSNQMYKSVEKESEWNLNTSYCLSKQSRKIFENPWNNLCMFFTLSHKNSSAISYSVKSNDTRIIPNIINSTTPP